MSKVGIIVCSNGCLDYVDHKYEFETVRSKLIFGEEEFVDFIDISATEFYKKLEDNPKLFPSTAQASPGTMIEAMERTRDKGHKEAIFITIAGALSGTYQGAINAATQVEGIDVKVFDSRNVAFGEGIQILEALKLAEEGKSADEIISQLEYLRSNTNVYVVVDTLKYLVKNGRLSGAAGLMGSMLKIKPLCKIDGADTGIVDPIEKIRTTSKARKRAVELYIRDIENRLDHTDLFALYTNEKSKKDLYELIDELKELLPSIGNIQVVPLSPVVGAHAGPGTIGLGYMFRKGTRQH